MASQPTLETERLLLRPFTVDDAATVQQLAGDPAIADTTLNIPHPYEDGMAEEWMRTHRPGFEAGTLAVFAIVRRDDDQLAGAIGLTIEAEFDKAELGYWVGKPYWGSGYATEAARAIIDFGFESLGLNRVHAAFLTRNPASGRVMRKAGMRPEGIARQATMKHGRYEDLENYAILRRHWSQAADTDPPASQSIAHIALLVRDYDEAIEFFTSRLRFSVVEDIYQPAQDKRWVLVAPPGNGGSTLLLAQASDDAQKALIGRQSGGRVFLFLATDDLKRDYDAMREAGIVFVREPKKEDYGTVAVFEDLHGNLWDLIEYVPGHAAAL